MQIWKSTDVRKLRWWLTSTTFDGSRLVGEGPFHPIPSHLRQVAGFLTANKPLKHHILLLHLRLKESTQMKASLLLFTFALCNQPNDEAFPFGLLNTELSR